LERTTALAAKGLEAPKLTWKEPRPSVVSRRVPETGRLAKVPPRAAPWRMVNVSAARMPAAKPDVTASWSVPARVTWPVAPTKS
jgi:hypothetical protein